MIIFFRILEPGHAVWWYTAEPFFYSIMNKALRTYDFETIILFRTFINDMYQFLKSVCDKDQQKSNSENHEPFLVYRGQAISSEDLEQIQNNKGELIAFNNFTSTTKNREKGLFFADSSGAKLHGLHSVLFEIQLITNKVTIQLEEEATVVDYKQLALSYNNIGNS